MTSESPTPVPRRFDAAKAVRLSAFALVVANVTFLALSYWNGYWFINGDGEIAFLDFLSIWAAGKLTLGGNAVGTYDWAIHKLTQEVIVGHSLVDFFPWFYPPPFLFVAMLLALMPYVPAFAVWLAVSFVAYLAVVRVIVGNNEGILLAAAFPAVVANAMVGQNGFLTAAFFGGFLLLARGYPVTSGILLGLLSFKPHFGLLIPIALACGGYWRVIASAAVTCVVTGILCAFAFGVGPWEAFFHSLTLVKGILLHGIAWHKLHSVYGLVRQHGGSDQLGWIVQGAAVGVTAFAVAWLWAGQARFELKAAGLGVGALLATPYLFIYDLVILAVPLAFLIRAAQETRYLPGERPSLAVVSLLIFSFAFIAAPVGLMAILLVALLVGRRVLVEAGWGEAVTPRSSALSSPSI